MNPITALLFVLALAQPTAPKFSAQLHAAHEAIAPGGQTELAIELEVEKDWHIYHPITLDTGLPTTVTFDAPAGVTFGELRFPTPYYDAEDAGDVKLAYLAHDGRVILLTTLELGPDFEPGPFTIRATVQALACKELCLPVETQALLTLDAAPGEYVAVNEKLFEEAREWMPKPLADSPYIKGSRIAVSEGTLGLDEEGEIVLTVRVKKNHHILSPNPGVEGLIPSRLFIEKLDGVEFGEQIWPKPHIKKVPGLGTVQELSGEFQIRVAFKIVDDQFPSGPVALRALFTYQCCLDSGSCFPPESARSVVRFVADTPNLAVALRGTLLPTVNVVGAADLDQSSADTSGRAAAAPPVGASGLLWILVLAFVGGMILNITPCVFPVMSIKIISFVQQAGEDRARILKLGLTFCAGIMVWFWIFGILTGLGEVPLQYPPVAIGVAALLFVFALSLFGVFEILLPGAAESSLGEATTREGYSGAFVKGLLATLLGTACTAPFFATAAAFATTQPLAVSFLIFTAAGVGMSAPYVVLSAFPGWLRFLPKPGAWMITFKQIMGFVLLGTIIWLLLVVADQIGARGVVWTVCFLGFLGLSVWLIGKIQLNWETPARLITWLAAIAIAVGGLWFSFFVMFDLPAAMDPEANNQSRVNLASITADAIIADASTSDWNDHIPWQPWRPGLAEEAAALGRTVYVDYTATWCVTCQTNKATSVEVDSIRTKMKEMGVIPIKGDYTNRNSAMRQVLLDYGRNSVPLNLIYPAGKPDEPITLPVILTPGIVSDALDRAGPSTVSPDSTGALPLATRPAAAQGSQAALEP